AWDALRARGPERARVNPERQLIGGVAVVRYVPPGRTPRRVILYLHGGSFIYGSERSHAEIAAGLALAAEAEVILPLYRLAPEHPFPAALEDVITVYHELLARGVQSTQLVLAGDSAGGNLTLATLLVLRDSHHALPAGAVPISPWLDLEDQSGSMQRHSRFDWAEPWMFQRWAKIYLGPGGDARDPRASPARAELSGLPPCLLVVGTAEMLYDQVCAFAQRARACGVEIELSEWPERVHLWLALKPMFPEFQATFDKVGEFVKRVTA
ncbi:MAG TPA: alpha/beta hydrolase, partial [Polyangiaceae bacterium]|nr:alpha/beta hydrolase [Polyangiaceae bacterium]